jgi:glycosyltransferase involved in cell wall biosynthesis
VSEPVGGAGVTVSIAIPVHNGAVYIESAIESVLAQSHRPDEIVVFDNASTDVSTTLAERLLGAAAIRAADTNRGAPWNFRRAVEESHGQYFAWLASDDRLAPEFVERTVERLRNTPRAAACLTGIQFLSPEGSLLGIQQDPLLASDDTGLRLRSFLRRPRWTEVYCMYRREALLASPMFTQAFGTDVMLTWWFLLRGPLAVVEDPLLEYRVFPDKTLDHMGDALYPGSRPQLWRRMRMWRALWRTANANDVSEEVRRVARRELLTALVEKQWILHNLADVRLALVYVRQRGRIRRQGGP